MERISFCQYQNQHLLLDFYGKTISGEPHNPAAIACGFQSENIAKKSICNTHLSHRRDWQRVQQQRGLRDGVKKKKKKRERETVVWRCFCLPPARSSVQSQLRRYIYVDSIYMYIGDSVKPQQFRYLSLAIDFRTFVGLSISCFGHRSLQTPNEQHPNWFNHEDIEIYTYQSHEWIWNLNWNLECLCQLRSYVKH